jgi:hypothetical protein
MRRRCEQPLHAPILSLQEAIARCFGQCFSEEAKEITDAFSIGRRMPSELTESGLWSNGWLLSPLVYTVILRMHVHKRRRRTCAHRYRCCSSLLFSQLDYAKLLRMDYFAMQLEIHKRPYVDGASCLVGLQMS